MGRAVKGPGPLASSREIWRLAALTTMGPEKLRAAIAGADAQAWVAAAAACGVPEAQLRLGRMLLEGEGIAQDRSAAFKWFSELAESDDAEAHNMLGRCYENGWGVSKNYRAAAHHYHIAAEAGVDWAQYNLGHMLLNGNGVTRNACAAFAWYVQASANGHARAMSLVGRCYENGWGVSMDVSLARDWYRRSAEGGYFRGAYNYAAMLADSGDLDDARPWFVKALETAPEPTRNNMLVALSRHADDAIRSLALKNT
jgi:TPR repeat protein